DIPLTTAEEDRARRRKAMEEAAKVRAIYEEMVLKKPKEEVVQIGSLTAMKTAVPGTGRTATVEISNAASNGSNGHANGNGANAVKPEVTEPEHVAGD
ncbi:MAG: hypothetical protein ACRD4A_01480, partial [Candidatus Acidiferrales bacterium]